MKNDILSALTNYGSMDIARCNEVLDEAEVLDSDLAENIRGMISGLDGYGIEDIDLVDAAYDFILNEARSEIHNATGKDIMNDLEENVSVAANYCATSYDWTDRALEETLDAANKVKEPSKTLQWFINHLG